MGLRFSAEKILGWRSQYATMLRWHQRCETRHRQDNTYNTDFFDALDHVSAFFVFSYHLYDYVLNSGKVDRNTLDLLVTSDANMRKCRDIANRIKHHTLSRSRSVDANWSVGREYVSFGETGEKLFFVIGDEKVDAMELVRVCVRFWNELIHIGILTEPQNPFAGNQ